MDNANEIKEEVTEATENEVENEEHADLKTLQASIKEETMKNDGLKFVFMMFIILIIIIILLPYLSKVL